MNQIHQCLSEGFSVLLGTEESPLAGWAVRTDGGERLLVTIEDVPQFPDPDQPAQQETPVYTRLKSAADAVKDPRAISQFIEVDSGLIHTVLKYEETSGDRAKWSWLCEAQRKQ